MAEFCGQRVTLGCSDRAGKTEGAEGVWGLELPFGHQQKELSGAAAALPVGKGDTSDSALARLCSALAGLVLLWSPWGLESLLWPLLPVRGSELSLLPSPLSL